MSCRVELGSWSRHRRFTHGSVVAGGSLTDERRDARRKGEVWPHTQGQN